MLTITLSVKRSMARSFSKVSHAKVVRLQYADLMAGKDMGKEIEEAYGPKGLGILTVSGVPHYPLSRLRLLRLAQPLALLPSDVLKSLEHEASTYNFGWSHGKEKFNGQPDLLKGSYYANPQTDVPTTDQNLIKEHPATCCPNIWPPEDVLPGFAAAFKDLGQMIVSVGLLVAKQADLYMASQNKAYERNKISGIIRKSRSCKARLLHYFPPTKEGSMTDWCGWHSDHGSLTGLTSALFTKNTKIVTVNPDPDCGLYIKARDGTQVKVQIPAEEIAYQLGESSQIQTGNLLQATPHFVRAPNPEKMQDVARNTFAVFMQPEWHEKLNPPDGSDNNAIERDVKSWKYGMDFSTFMKEKLLEYY